MTDPLAEKAALWARSVFDKYGVQMTLGGEPTYVPIRPKGTEWSFSAVGPTKLRYAEKMAAALLRGAMRGSAVFFSPGKQYPGEVNPRWALRMIKRRDGRPIFRARPGRVAADEATFARLRGEILARLGVSRSWLPFSEPDDGKVTSWVLPLDHIEGEWKSAKWPLKRSQCVLTKAEGPAGLRLPLYHLPDGIPRRALVIESKNDRLDIFFPPLLQEPFTRLCEVVGDALRTCEIGRFQLQGYVPQDETKSWITLGLAADPGVLEINLPVCAGWTDYDFWIREVTAAAERVGLRAWKEPYSDYVSGTGGGNHLLWGGPSVDENPFFVRPAWLASILRFWQRHPALAYAFTGNYVGASSQAPRPDESAKELFDIEMGYHFLEGMGPGDHRAVINETLRHLHTDVTGNAHRSEVSFDKFWNPGWPGGMLGLIEFRAVESLPRAEWMAAVALLWECAAAYCLKKPQRDPLRSFGTNIHDKYFLPSYLRDDLRETIAELRAGGCPIRFEPFAEILEWRFPVLLEIGTKQSHLRVRRAHESWPLLCETPTEGGSTSRFVDTSMHRVEVAMSPRFADTHDVYVNGRLLPVLGAAGGMRISGLRYRRSCLYPCMHPGIPPHLPLELAVVKKGTARISAAYRMRVGETVFSEHGERAGEAIATDSLPCRGMHEHSVTVDLRLAD